MDKEDIKLEVTEAKQKLYEALTEYTGWKFLKSGPYLREKIGDIIFEIVFYANKYNGLEGIVEISCEFRFWSRSLDKDCNINSNIGFYSIQPENKSWYNISTQSSLEKTAAEIEEKISRYVFPIVELIKGNVTDGLLKLDNKDSRELYHLNSFKAYDKLLQDIKN